MNRVRVFGVACVIGCAAVTVVGQSGATNGEWRTYGGDLGHTRYSPLDQVNATNFSALEVAWRFKTDKLGPRPEFQLEATPLMISVDEELGIAYLPVELPTGDYYGGHRPGNGLFGESLVAVDLHTGKRKWHFQFVHHGLWDMDIPCAPILADINVNGRIVKVVAQPTKQAWLYVFDRITGQPIWPIDERPVATGNVPGERYAPTQPFVTKPPAFDRQGVSVDDLINFTPELRAEAVTLAATYRIGPIFTPPTVSTVGGPLGTLVLPSATGGVNWLGGSYDPDTHTVFVYSQTTVSPLGRDADDEVAGHRRREPRNDDVHGAARCDAARVRQGGWKGSGSGVHRGAAKWFTDDVHAQREAVHRGGNQRRELQRGTGRVQTAGLAIPLRFRPRPRRSASPGGAGGQPGCPPSRDQRRPHVPDWWPSAQPLPRA